MALIVPMFAFTSCGGGDDEPSVPNQTLNVGQTYDIPVEGAWTSDNDLIASVDGNTLTGVRVGEVAVRNGGKSFNVTVNPTITLYKDPCLQFGDNPSAIKKFMSSYAFESEESESSLIYTSRQSGAAVGYGYTFESSKLTLTMVMAQRSIASTERLAEYLSQRFVPVTHNDDYIGMISPDKKILVVFMIKYISGSLMYVTSYAPNTSDANGRSDNYDVIIKEMINATPGELVKSGLR